MWLCSSSHWSCEVCFSTDFIWVGFGIYKTTESTMPVLQSWVWALKTPWSFLPVLPLRNFSENMSDWAPCRRRNTKQSRVDSIIPDEAAKNQATANQLPDLEWAKPTLAESSGWPVTICRCMSKPSKISRPQPRSAEPWRLTSQIHTYCCSP